MKRLAVLAAVLGAAACSDGSGTGPDPVAGPLTAAGGMDQHAPAGTTLPAPYTVLVQDDEGSPVAGQVVSWAVTSGEGTISPTSSVTDSAGHASSWHTLGPNAGEQAVRAHAGPSAVEFVAHSNPPGGALLVGTVPIPADYGIHDTFVRDGIAFVFAWNTGVITYDVGHGIRGGSPSRPVEVSRIVPPVGAVSGARGFIHNGWWFHNPVSGEKRYLFVGQEAPGMVGSSSRGDIFVIDVSDLANPVAVAQFGLAGAGTHNFWVDEPAQVLYAAYYNGGVVALDVSGTLSGDLSGRLLGQVRPGGAADTYVWGVQVSNGSLYASDMRSGLWQLSLAGEGLQVLSGGNNVPDRYSSDLWVMGNLAYTGTWGGGPRRDSLGNLKWGDVINAWAIDANGGLGFPTEIVVQAQTVSDVEINRDGSLLVVTLERGAAAGFAAYDLASPFVPRPVAGEVVESGLHTGTLGVIGGRTFLFAAKNPPEPALMVWDLSALVP